MRFATAADQAGQSAPQVSSAKFLKDIGDLASTQVANVRRGALLRHGPRQAWGARGGSLRRCWWTPRVVAGASPRVSHQSLYADQVTDDNSAHGHGEGTKVMKDGDGIGILMGKLRADRARQILTALLGFPRFRLGAQAGCDSPRPTGL